MAIAQIPLVGRHEFGEQGHSVLVGVVQVDPQNALILSGDLTYRRLGQTLGSGFGNPADFHVSPPTLSFYRTLIRAVLPAATANSSRLGRRRRAESCAKNSAMVLFNARGSRS
jgi:hypothetical protein